MPILPATHYINANYNCIYSSRRCQQGEGPVKLLYGSILHHLPPSSSLSDMNVSCMDSGARTRYFSSVVVVVVVVTTVSVTTFK